MSIRLDKKAIETVLRQHGKSTLSQIQFYGGDGLRPALVKMVQEGSIIVSVEKDSIGEREYYSLKPADVNG